MRHVGRSLYVFLLGCAALLAGCGGGVPGPTVAAGSLPPPPKGIVAGAEAPQVFSLAGDGRAGPFVAWLDRGDGDPAIKAARYDGRLEAAWGQPRVYSGEIPLPDRGVHLTVAPFPDGSGSLLAFRAGRRVFVLHPEQDWQSSVDYETEFDHFVVAAGPAGVWAVVQMADGAPQLVRYRLEGDEWTVEAPFPAVLGPRSPALAVDEVGVTVAYLDLGEGGDLSGDALIAALVSADLEVIRWDGASWSDPVVIEQDAGAVEPVLCPGGGVVAWMAQRSGGHRVVVAVDRGGVWERDVLREAPGVVNELQCVVDAAGRALVVWMANEQAAGETPTHLLWAARFDGAGWQEPERLAEPDADPGQADLFDLAGQPRDGQAVVVYHMRGDRGEGGIWARRFDPIAGWGPPRLVSGCCAPAQVAMDGSGTAAVLWVDKQGPLWWARLDPEAVP